MSDHDPSRSAPERVVPQDGAVHDATDPVIGLEELLRWINNLQGHRVAEQEVFRAAVNAIYDQTYRLFNTMQEEAAGQSPRPPVPQDELHRALLHDIAMEYGHDRHTDETYERILRALSTHPTAPQPKLPSEPSTQLSGEEVGATAPEED